MSGGRFIDHQGVRMAAYAVVFLVHHHLMYYPVDSARSLAALLPVMGLVLGVLLLSPVAAWKRYLVLSAALAMSYNAVFLAASWVTNVGLISTSVLQIWVTAWSLRRLCGGRPGLGRLGHVFALIGAAILWSGAGSVVATFFVFAEPGRDPLVFFQTRWVGNTLAALIVTPLVVVWGAGTWRRWSTRQVIEGALWLALTGVIASLALSTNPRFAPVLPAPFLVLVPLLAVTIRLGVHGTTAAMVLVTLQVMAAVARPGAWPAGDDLLTRLAVAELFLGVMAVTGLILGASLGEKENALGEVRASEARFRALFENSVSAVGLFTGPHLVVANPAFARLFGGGGSGTLAPGLALADLVQPAERERLAAWLLQAGHGERKAAESWRGRRADGAEFPLELRLTPFAVEEAAGLLVDARDQTEQFEAERETRRVNRALLSVTGCIHALVRAKTEDGLMHAVCEALTASGGFRLAWVGLVEHDAAKSVRRVAQAGEGIGYLEGLRVSWGDEVNGQGPSGQCIRSGRPFVCQDMATDPNFAPWREAASRHGLRASIALPLREGGAVFGVLSFYAREPGAFEPEIVDLLVEMADTMAYGITALRAQARQQATEAEVRRLLGEAERARTNLLSILEDYQLAEREKEHSEQRFRDAMRNAAIGMSLVAPDGRWLEVNPALCEIVGYTEQELLARNFGSITHPDDVGPDRLKVQELLDGRIATVELEKRYLHKSGRVVWVRLNFSLVRDAEGRPRHIVTQTQDITARKQAEEALAATTERLALALRASKFGVWRHNLQTHATEWDERMFALFGLPPASSSPSLDAILMAVVEEDRGAVRRLWQAPGQVAGDRSYQLRFRVQLPNRALRHLELHGMVHEDEHGRPEWSIGVAGDITEIIDATTDAERLRAQLQQSQKMEALGNLAAGVAHDFNNLLTGINGFVELASKSLAPGHEAGELLRQARRGALSARDLVRRILNFSRSKADQSRVVLNMVEVVRDTAPLVAAALPTNVSFLLTLGDTPAPVQADGGQIQQILMNLCTNAAHAIGRKAGQIQVSVEVCDLNFGGTHPLPHGCVAGRHVRLAVRDSGSGMDEATQRRIFEPFFTTKKAGEGTGLGLAIVRDIVAAHEGGVEVTSVLGMGTTFAIYLPYARTEAEVSAASTAPVPSRGGGQRVLIVDDEPTVGAVVRLALQKSGYAPTAYVSSTEAWRIFAEDPRRFELLIVDQNMPELTGQEFIARARALAPRLPVILMSGRFEQADGGVGPSAERVALLKKPFEIVDLVGTVKAALDQAPGRAPEQK